RLEEAGIAYVVVGGMAVNAHGHERMTDDVDVLVTRDGFNEFCRLYVPKEYDRVPRGPRRFIDRQTKRNVDFLITGRFPGSGEPGPTPFPHPEAVRQKIRRIYFMELPT